MLRERVEAMKAVWTQEEVSYTGEFVTFERIISYPKPVQKRLSTPATPEYVPGAPRLAISLF